MRARSLVLLGLACLGGTLAGAAGLPEEEARRVLFDLKSGNEERVAASFDRIRELSDERFAAPLIELLRAYQIPIASGFAPRELVELLEALTGQMLGGDWSAWVEWYGGTDLAPPPGFTGWKGALYSRIDDDFGRVLPLGAPARIRVEEIVWGGVGFESIAALDQPRTLAAEAATELPESAAVFGVSLGGEARAYPLRILDWHELANDVVGGVPLSLAYCTLCGSAIAYDRRAPDGAVYDFGSSGLLMRSNKLMVDRQTSSLWNQITGEPVVGPLVDGPPLRLAVLPSVVTTWGAWKRRHPHTTVLSPDTGHGRSYTPGAAYADYFASDALMFPVRAQLGKLAAKERVFGIYRDGAARAWPLGKLAEERVVNDAVGDRNVVIVASGAPVEVAGTSLRSGVERRYSVGLEIRAYARGERTLAGTPDEGRLVDGSGAPWLVEESALVGPTGERLARVAGVVAYWFGWVSYHPRTSLF